MVLFFPLRRPRSGVHLSPVLMWLSPRREGLCSFPLLHWFPFKTVIEKNKHWYLPLSFPVALLFSFSQHRLLRFSGAHRGSVQLAGVQGQRWFLGAERRGNWGVCQRLFTAGHMIDQGHAHYPTLSHSDTAMAVLTCKQQDCLQSQSLQREPHMLCYAKPIRVVWWLSRAMFTLEDRSGGKGAD